MFKICTYSLNLKFRPKLFQKLQTLVTNSLLCKLNISVTLLKISTSKNYSDFENNKQNSCLQTNKIGIPNKSSCFSYTR